MTIIQKARETGLAAALGLAVLTAGISAGASAALAEGAPVRIAVQAGEHRSEAAVQLVDGRGRDREWRRDGHRGGHRDWGRGHHWGRLDAREIRRSLRHQGYRHIRILGERGRVYIASATGWRGMPMRLIVDARSGAVVSREPIGRGHSWEYRW